MFATFFQVGLENNTIVKISGYYKKHIAVSLCTKLAQRVAAISLLFPVHISLFFDRTMERRSFHKWMCIGHHIWGGILHKIEYEWLIKSYNSYKILCKSCFFYHKLKLTRKMNNDNSYEMTIIC